MRNKQDNTQSAASASECSQSNNREEVKETKSNKKEETRLKFKKEDMYEIKYNF